ncbi:MAG TPA: HNH endonuclease [bacterium]|nr:HNH endonuclease [bacterium]
MLSSSVLVVNRSFMPVHITTVRRALTMLYQGVAKAVNEQYEVFNFDDWSQLKPKAGDAQIGLVHGAIKIPRVILLITYDRIPKRHVRFSRLNIFLRDRNTCQYCGRSLPRRELNIDHVVPRSRGGTSVWENVVCSCLECNRRKGGRTPDEAGVRLVKRPSRPRWTPNMGFKFDSRQYKEWVPFLNFIDVSYWNAELVE